MSDYENLHPLLKLVNPPVTNMSFFVIVSLCFLLYAASEIYTAIYSNSLSLLGDSVALSVEICTFILLMQMDIIKAHSSSGISRPMFLLLDVYLPFLFMIGLIVGILYIMIDASLVISSNGNGYSSVNVLYLYLYSLSNWMFYVLNTPWNPPKREPASSNESPADDQEVLLRDPEVVSSLGNTDDTVKPASRSNGYGTNTNNQSPTISTLTSDTINYGNFGESAYQMFYALIMSVDILRNLIVLVAAIIITTTSISSPLVDAIAALLVVLTMLPLFVPFIWKFFYAKN